MFVFFLHRELSAVQDFLFYAHFIDRFLSGLRRSLKYLRQKQKTSCQMAKRRLSLQ